ncbi:MAG: Sigma-54-dependent Fis family transcriptional regulator [Candidatus Poribacteria bacterium]|nr:Sigma-54-dependent Fis family transcriptional regulator [Candidatus Poribacteria bacterium]
MKPFILIVDDEETQRIMLKKILVREGYDVETASNGRDALEKFKETSADVVVTDIKMPDMNGLELFREIKRLNTDTLVILITAYGTIESAVQVMAEGASYYLTKPIDPNHLKVLIKKALESKNLLEENRQLREEVMSIYGFGQIVGHSNKMQEIYSALKKVAESDATVLLLGETGTGKELAAHAIHYNSTRRDHSFVKVSCATLPETLLESALFGHERGAYTGADSRQIGMFEKADKGTIFLDEIGDINQNVQIKLLRFLQEKEFERVGSTQPIRVDARVIAATNADLEKSVQELKIRKDLYYRLNVVQICMPPLRERSEDILLLTEHFLEKHKDKVGGKVKKISPEVLSIFERHDWPGNVRELENCIERAIVMGKDELIQPSDLPAYLYSINSTVVASSNSNSLEEVAKDLILKALRKTGGNQVKASKNLGISRRTLQYRMGKYGISAKDIKSEN